MKSAQLESLLTPARMETMRRVLARRLCWVTIVLDNLHDRHNISAILRSCDAFGVQEIHVVESIEKFEVNPLVSQGVERWLIIHRWPSFGACAAHLRRRRFAMYATALGVAACSMHDLPLDKKIAIVFGNEHRGVADSDRARCDGNVLIPMHGFTQSLNVSVAAAVTLAVLTEKLRAQCGHAALLSPRARRMVYQGWLRTQAGKRGIRTAKPHKGAA